VLIVLRRLTEEATGTRLVDPIRSPEVYDNRRSRAGRAFEFHVTLVMVDNLFADG
jgi:hypothetical protein